jgi:hypothetical protein
VFQGASCPAKWLLNAHVIAQYTYAIKYPMDTFTGTWSEQQVNSGHIKKDLKDLQTFQHLMSVTILSQEQIAIKREIYPQV